VDPRVEPENDDLSCVAGCRGRISALQGFRFGHPIRTHSVILGLDPRIHGLPQARHARKISDAPSAINAKPAACPQVSDSFSQKTEKPEKTSSVITSCMVFNWAAE